MRIDKDSSLYIATPAYGAMLNAAYVHSLLRTSNKLALSGIRHTPAFVPGDSLITRARNVLVSQFMAGPYTHLFFIDSDLRWEPDDVLRLLAATSHPDIEVACGIYPKKCLPPEFSCQFHRRLGPQAEPARGNGLHRDQRCADRLSHDPALGVRTDDGGLSRPEMRAPSGSTAG
jgi:hypothetical protein